MVFRSVLLLCHPMARLGLQGDISVFKSFWYTVYDPIYTGAAQWCLYKSLWDHLLHLSPSHNLADNFWFGVGGPDSWVLWLETQGFSLFTWSRLPVTICNLGYKKGKKKKSSRNIHDALHSWDHSASGQKAVPPPKPRVLGICLATTTVTGLPVQWAEHTHTVKQ